MSPCCQTPPHLARIREIKKNQKIPSGLLINPDPEAGAPDIKIPCVDLRYTGMTPIFSPVMPPEAPQDRSQTPPEGEAPTTGTVSPALPSYAVPPNPMLPPSFQEALDYNEIQYLNAFQKTQIGKYVMVEQLIGSNRVVNRHGYLIAVGTNYIVLQDAYTGNVAVIDGYTVKYMYIYYNLPTVSQMLDTYPGNGI